MIDLETKERIVVYSEGNAPPYLTVLVDQLDAIESILRANNIRYCVDSEALSINGQPEVVDIELGRTTNAEEVQRLLDAAN